MQEGILLSTFPGEGMKHPEAHLNYLFNGRFDLFSHHVAKNEKSEDERKLFLGFIMRNPGNRKIHVQVLSGASYLSQPDAPFISLPEICLNNEGKIFAGPGDRVTDDVLRGRKPDFLSKTICLNPGEDKLVLALPVPVRNLRPALNGRSTLLKFKTNGPLYLASVAKFVPRGDTAPEEEEFLDLLYQGKLCEPRDEAPTPPGQKKSLKYGRVAGVSEGTEWSGKLSDAECIAPPQEANAETSIADKSICAERRSDADKTTDTVSDDIEIPLKNSKPGNCLNIPAIGKSFTYPLSTVEGGSFGTGQIQSANLIVRYPDTAYQAHGNYGVRYRIEFPLFNPYTRKVTVQLLFQSALKSNETLKETCFYESPAPRAFFRGTVFARNGKEADYWHLVQKQGAEGAKIAEVTMPPQSSRRLFVDFIYPPDATPPQELCLRSLEACLED